MTNEEHWGKLEQLLKERNEAIDQLNMQQAQLNQRRESIYRHFEREIMKLNEEYNKSKE